MISFLRNLIFHDFILKLFSVGLAVLIWMTVSFAIRKEVSPVANFVGTAPEQRTFFSVPVIVMSTAADVRDVKVRPSEVEVTVRGESKVVRNLKGAEIRAIVDLTGIESARELRKRIDVSTPVGVALVVVSPEEVQVLVPPKR
jgi:hypothetical protein